MLEVLLDTSIYRSDPWRRKAGFNALELLANSGKLRLHIPFFVREEFVSQQVEIYEKNITAIFRGIMDLQRKPMKDDFRNKLESASSLVTEIQNELLSYPETEFAKWVDRVRGIYHPIAASHGERVARAYFDGSAPFKSRKNREDLPDAFIWQVILDLAKEFDTLYVIVGDGELRNSCEMESNISSFHSLGWCVKSCGLYREQEILRAWEWIGI